MKKLLTLCFFFLSILLSAQIDTPPTGSNFKTLPTYSFKWYTSDSTLWMYKGSTYGWTNISKGFDSLRYYRLLNNHDSLSKLQERSYHSLIDTPNLDLKANVASPTFTGTVTIPALNIPTSAAVNYFWKCTNAATGAGTWASVSASQLYKGTIDGDDGKPNGGTALKDGTGTAGWFYVCIDAGTYDYGNPSGNSITLALNDQIHYNGTIWQKVPAGSSQWITTGSDIYYNSGNAGILTTTPSAPLDVRGNVRIGDGTTAEQDINFISANGDWQVGTNNAGGGTSGNQFYFYNANDSKYVLTMQRGTSRVGILTASPGYQLTVSAAAGSDVISWKNPTYELGRLGFSGDNNSGWLGLYSAGTKNVHISSGNNSYILGYSFGIGTSSLTFEGAGAHGLHLNNTGAATTEVHLTNSTTGALATDGFSLQLGSTGIAYLYNQENTNMVFVTNDAVGMTLTPAGALTITDVMTATGGNSTQWNTAYTHSQIAGGNSVHVSTDENTQWDAAYTHSTNNSQAHSDYLLNNANDATSGTLTATNFILSSDKRLKENITYIKDITKYRDIRFYQFNLKSEPGQLRFGVLAQQIESSAPELVRTDNEGMKSVAYIDLLIIKIQDLENRVNELEKANERLVKRDLWFYKKMKKHEK